MKKSKMCLIKSILLLLSFRSASADVAVIESLTGGVTRGNDIGPTKTYGQGEVVMGGVRYEGARPIFRRIEKIDTIPVTSSKTETVDMSPKLALGNDEDIFWEVTKLPENNLSDGVRRSDFVNGNHPDLFELITHDHVDKTTGHSAQSKRVKKILPPFDARRDEALADGVAKRNARNISKPKIIAIKVSDLKGINHREGKSNGTTNTLKGIVDNGPIPSPHVPPSGGMNNSTEPNEVVTKHSSADKMELKKMQILTQAMVSGDEVTPTASASTTIPSSNYVFHIPDAVGDSSRSDNKSKSRVPMLKTRGKADENEKAVGNGSGSPIADVIDIQKGWTPGVHKVGETKTNVASKSLVISLLGKGTALAPDGKNSATPLADDSSTGTRNGEADDLKIHNPEFLLVPEKTGAETDGSGHPETEKAPSDDGEGEIQGIPLVPNEIEPKRKEPTTQRTIFDLLRERERIVSGDGGKDDAAGSSTSPRSLYGNFDEDSAEVEYETENFQHGYSNIEKHELPYSHALPWLDAKDKSYQLGNEDGRKEDKRKSGTHSKINDFPSILSMNKNYFRSKEEIQIPKDFSKLLKLSQSENSAIGVTMSIVDSGTNHEDTTLYGHRPSKWYLLLLTGNSTIVKLRREDFTKYLKVNLAARLSVEYDDIKVNKVILRPPKVLVNISVYAPSDDIAEESQLDVKEKFEDKGEAPLHKLAETNATLLELSGEPYHVVRFLSLQSQQPEAEAQKDSVPNSVSLAVRHDDVEFIVYTFIGSACACAVILTLFVSLGKYLRKLSEHRWPWKKFKPTASIHRRDAEQDEFNGISPAVIYSGGFPQIRGSWMSGVGSRVHPPQTDSPSAAPSLAKQYPGVGLGMPQRKSGFLHPEADTRSCGSPRHNKLQIYGAGANNLVLPVPPQKSKSVKAEGGDVHPLDVRIPVKRAGFN